MGSSFGVASSSAGSNVPNDQGPRAGPEGIGREDLWVSSQISATGDHRRVSRRTQSLLAALTGLVATFGYAGALGLMTGAVHLSAAEIAELPLHSPALTGLAEVVMVAVPMTVVTRFAVKADVRTARAAVVAGALLLVWVVLEVAVLGEFSWLEAVLAAAGLVVLLVGLRDRTRFTQAGPARRGR